MPAAPTPAAAFACETVAIGTLDEARQVNGIRAFVRAMWAADPDGPNTVEELGSGILACGPVGVWWNQAVGLGMAGRVTDAEVDRLVAFYTERGIEPRVEVASVAHPSLAAGLTARGFVFRGFEHALARRLSPGEDFAAAWPHPWPADITIERLDPADDAAVTAAGRLFVEGFQPDLAADEDAMRRRMAESVHVLRCSLGIPEFAAFVARHTADGRVVGYAAADIHGTAAGLFAGVVHASARRQGVQGRLLVARLEHVRAHGAQWATIGSDPGTGTERNAQRLGFRLAYVKGLLVKPGPGLVPSP